MVGSRAFARTPTAMGPPVKKDYQTKAASAATEQLAMPETVTLAMADLAETVKEGLLALAVGAGFGVMEVICRRASPASAGRRACTIPTARPYATAARTAR